MNHIRLYNSIRKALRDNEFERAKELATELERALKSSGATYGWSKLPLSGRNDVDDALLLLDPYLTETR